MSAPRPAARRSPLVAVFHDVGSASPLTILSAARRICDVLFIGDLRQPHVAAGLAAVQTDARVLDVAGRSECARLDVLREVAPDAVVTFSEYQLGATSQAAAALGVPFHGPATVKLLTDKIAQRRALAHAGVDATPCASIDDDPVAVLDTVGLPAVVKPRAGAGSAHTVRVDTREEFRAVVAGLPRGGAFVAERLLSGDPNVAGRACGDYVSVESVTTPAGSQQVCMTGKFPLAPPFRETGMFLPSTLSGEAAAEVLALERAALMALGVRHGITHTEIKLTAHGPRIIEVNGRLGGYVPEILRRATGVDLVAIALQVALGGEPKLPPRAYRGVTFQLFMTPPMHTRRLVALDGMQELAALPGIRHVEVRGRPGQALDWRQGTESHLGVVYGSASNHSALWELADSVTATARPRYDADRLAREAVGV